MTSCNMHIKLNDVTGDIMSHIAGAAAFENKHSGLSFEVVALHFTGRFSHFPRLLCSLHVFDGSSHFCLELSSRGN